MKRFIRPKGAIMAFALFFVLSSVFAGSGDPVPGVEVSLENANGKKMNATTDKDGEYSFNNLDKGTYTVRVRCASGACVSMRDATGRNMEKEIHFSSSISSPDKDRDNRNDDAEGTKKKKEGYSTGKRQHKPITLSKDWSSVSTITIETSGSSIEGEITAVSK